MIQVGSFMGFAEKQAVMANFTMDKTYKARLAKHIRLELEKGTHPDDIRAAVRVLVRKKLSPFLLDRKVAEARGGAGPLPIDEPDPYEDFPDYSSVS